MYLYILFVSASILLFMKSLQSLNGFIHCPGEGRRLRHGESNSFSHSLSEASSTKKVMPFGRLFCDMLSRLPVVLDRFSVMLDRFGLVGLSVATAPRRRIGCMRCPC